MGIKVNPHWTPVDIDIQHDNFTDNKDDDKEAVSSDDEWCEDTKNDHPFCGNMDTMLTAQDFIEDTERNQVYSIAPAEGNRPISIFKDLLCEELSFQIFLQDKQEPRIEK